LTIGCDTVILKQQRDTGNVPASRLIEEGRVVENLRKGISAIMGDTVNQPMFMIVESSGKTLTWHYDEMSHREAMDREGLLPIQCFLGFVEKKGAKMIGFNLYAPSVTKSVKDPVNAARRRLSGLVNGLCDAGLDPNTNIFLLESSFRSDSRFVNHEPRVVLPEFTEKGLTSARLGEIAGRL
jgi:hypothetical protein